MTNRISRVEPPKSNFKNLILTAVLAVLVLAVAYESAKRGVFPLKREATQTIPSETATATATPEPTPTPLPSHFPATEDDDLRNSKRVSTGLIEAFKACWPLVALPENSVSDEMTVANVEKLFGKIKKRETLEETDASRRLGLLFGDSIFSAGAAGSATETADALDGLRDLQVRAAGRMLHCDDAHRCECLSNVAP